MKKKNNLFLTGCLALCTLTACTDSIDDASDTRDPADAVTLSVNTDGANPQTRVTTGSTEAYIPDQNVDLHLYSNSLGSSITAVYNNTAGDQTTNATWEAKTGTSPLYWDDAIGTDGNKLYSFYAVVNAHASSGKGSNDNAVYTIPTNQADPATGSENFSPYERADLLTAYTYTTRRRQDLQFTLKHLMAQLTVTLTTLEGNDGFSPTQLAGATAEASLIAPYTLVYTDVANTTNADKAKETPTTATASGTTSTAFTMQRTLHYKSGTEETAGNVASVTFRLIAPPQTISSTDGGIVLTIDGKTYTFKPDKPENSIQLTAGRNTIQPIVARKSVLIPGTIQLKDWDTSTNASQSVTADGVVTPQDIDLSGITETGTLYLRATTPTRSVTDGTIGTYPIQYQTSSTGGTASINTADAAYAPILWDNLNKWDNDASTGTLQKYYFHAVFIPTNYRHATNTGADRNKENHEKDYLEGRNAATEWGESPKFTENSSGSGDDRRLEHQTVRFIVNLKSDGTYDAATLNSASIKLKRNKKMTISGSGNNAWSSISDGWPSITTATLTSGESADVTLVKIEDATDSGSGATEAKPARFVSIIAPQTLGANSASGTTIGTDYLILTLGSGTVTEKIYTLKAADKDGLTLKYGSQYTLTATLTKSELNPGTIAVEAWKEESGEGNFEWQ